MAALTSAPFVFLFTFSGIFAQSPENIKAKSGDDATLLCQGPLGAAIGELEWKRSDLKSDEFVFLFRDGSPVEIYQLEGYHGRVDLRDPEMKNGDASVILRNVTGSDTGRYECFVPNSNGGRRRRAADITKTIYLEVTESGGDGGRGRGGLIAASVGVPVALCLVALFVGRSLKKKSEPPAADGTDVQNSLNP